MRKEIIPVTKSSLPDLERYLETIKPIWENHWMTNKGEIHQKFSEQLIEKMKVPYVSLFVNGHMALEMALQSLELEGEVITTPFTFASTTHAIVRNGLTPVFCDVDPYTYTIDVNKIESLITEKTCAIVPVHVYGTLCDVEAIEEIAKKYDLKVIYDAAHAFNVTYKNINVANFGDMSMFSFHATKVFNSIEGGAITFSEKKYQKKLERLKNFGIKDEETVDFIGANAKMNEFQAAMGLCNLPNLEEEIQKRAKIVEQYNMHLSDIPGIQLKVKQVNVKENYSYYPIVINSKKIRITRNEIFQGLKEEGILARKYFYPMTNEYECYKEKFGGQKTPIAKKISESVFTLPLYANLSLESVDRISQTLLNIIK